MATSNPWEYLIDFRSEALQQTMAFWVYRIDCSGGIEPEDAPHDLNTMAVVNVIVDQEGHAHAIVAPVREGQIVHAEAVEVTHPSRGESDATYHFIDPVCGYDLYVGYRHLVGDTVRGLANGDDNSSVSLGSLAALAG
jgi:hypothetical protein